MNAFSINEPLLFDRTSTDEPYTKDSKRAFNFGPIQALAFVGCGAATIFSTYTSAMEYHNNLVDANRDVDGMKAAIKSVGISALEELCTPKNFTSTSSLLDIMDTNMDTLQTDAYQGLEQLRCDNVVPLYVNTAYNGACTYGINGLFWTTLSKCYLVCLSLSPFEFLTIFLHRLAAFAIMSISGFIMVLFRAAVINNASGSFIPKSQPGPHPRPPGHPKKAVAIL